MTARRIIQFESPTLRDRYRDGLTIETHGFPDWIPYARVAVALPLTVPGQGVDEVRVVDVLTANAVMGGAGDPLWTVLPPLSTPPGWTWAHLELCRTIVLVPIELYLASRHQGGVATGAGEHEERGIRGCDGPPPGRVFHERLLEETLAVADQRLGDLPVGYRRFLGDTNGAGPVWPAVHPGFGFVLDQPLFGLARPDPMFDLGLVYAAFRDRLTSEFLPIGYVHGGLLAVRMGGADAGSIWYYDSDDARDRGDLSAAEICARLLHRCADDFDAFWASLRAIPDRLRARAGADAHGAARPIALPRMGDALPSGRRARDVPEHATSTGRDTAQEKRMAGATIRFSVETIFDLQSQAGLLVSGWVLGGVIGPGMVLGDGTGAQATVLTVEFESPEDRRTGQRTLVLERTTPSPVTRGTVLVVEEGPTVPIDYEYYAIYATAVVAGLKPVTVMASEVADAPPRLVLYSPIDKKWLYDRYSGARYLFDSEGQEETELISRTNAERIARELGLTLPSERELHRMMLIGEADWDPARPAPVRSSRELDFRSIFRFLIGESPEDLEPVFAIDGRDYTDLDALHHDLDEAEAALDRLHLINGRERQNGGPGSPRSILPSWAQWRDQYIVRGEPIGVRPVTVRWAAPTGWDEMHAWLEQSHQWLWDQLSAAAASVPGADVETISDRGPRRIGPGSALEPSAEKYQVDAVLLVVPPEGQPIPDALAVICEWLRQAGWDVEEPDIEPDATTIGATHHGYRMDAVGTDEESSITLMAKSPIVDAAHFAGASPS